MFFWGHANVTLQFHHLFYSLVLFQATVEYGLRQNAREGSRTFIIFGLEIFARLFGAESAESFVVLADSKST